MAGAVSFTISDEQYGAALKIVRPVAEEVYRNATGTRPHQREQHRVMLEYVKNQIHLATLEQAEYVIFRILEDVTSARLDELRNSRQQAYERLVQV